MINFHDNICYANYNINFIPFHYIHNDHHHHGHHHFYPFTRTQTLKTKIFTFYAKHTHRDALKNITNSLLLLFLYEKLFEYSKERANR